MKIAILNDNIIEIVKNVGFGIECVESVDCCKLIIFTRLNRVLRRKEIIEIANDFQNNRQCFIPKYTDLDEREFIFGIENSGNIKCANTALTKYFEKCTELSKLNFTYEQNENIKKLMIMQILEFVETSHLDYLVERFIRFCESSYFPRISSKKYEELCIKIFSECTKENLCNDIYNLGNYEQYLEFVKPTILINGYELKYIELYYPYLENHYKIIVDEWIGHNQHNEDKSFGLLNKADIIFSEWMVGNAVWYSQRKKKHQKMYIRAHSIGAETIYYKNIDFSSVNNIITTSYRYNEIFNTLLNNEKSKLILVNKGVEINKYRKKSGISNTIGFIINCPTREELLKALEIIKQVHEVIPNVKMTFCVKIPQRPELASVSNDLDCYKEYGNYIESNNLSESILFEELVDFEGHCREFDIVLSTTDNEQSCGAVTSAFAANTCAMIIDANCGNYDYPQKYYYPSVEAISDEIIELYNGNLFNEYKKEGVEYIKRYNTKIIVEQFHKIFEGSYYES